LKEEREKRKKREKKREEEDRKKKEEEAERRKKDREEEVERKKREEEERKKLSTIEEDEKNKTPKQPSPSFIAQTTKQPTSPAYNHRTTSAETINTDGMNPEEVRILRAMSRAKSGTGLGTTGRSSSYKPAEPRTNPTPKPQSTAEPAWKEQERIRDAERQIRIAEENKKKEEERRAILEQQTKTKHAEQQRISEIQQRGGKMHTFVSPVVYDIDVEVKICGDFTDWQEIPITSEIDGSFQYAIAFPVNLGVHFYRFKIGNKWDVNKNLPTGVAPTGDVMNKVDIQ